MPDPVVDDRLEASMTAVLIACRDTLPGWRFRGLRPDPSRDGLWEASASGPDPWADPSSSARTGRGGKGYTPGHALRDLLRQMERLSEPIEPHLVTSVQPREFVDRCLACDRDVIPDVDAVGGWIHRAKRLNPVP